MGRIHNFKGWELHLEELNRSRRKFLKSLGRTAVVSSISAGILKTIFDWIRNSYGEEADEMKDAFEMRFSKEGERFLRNYYEDYVSNFDDELMIAKSEIISLFKNWTNQEITCIMNQKMYDALVMVCFRVGTENFNASEFVKAIKVSDYKKAVKILSKDGIETMWNCEKIEFVKKYELALLSSDSVYEDETEEADKPTVTSGPSRSDSEGLIQLRKTNYKNVKYDLDRTQYDKVNIKLLDDLQEAAENAGVVITITTAKSGHSFFTILGRESRHRKNIAVDIAIINGHGSGNATGPADGNPKFREWGNKLKDQLVKLGYVWNIESGNDKSVLWQTNTGGNHYNHLHVSRKSK